LWIVGIEKAIVYLEVDGENLVLAEEAVEATISQVCPPFVKSLLMTEDGYFFLLKLKHGLKFCIH
jgi:hypothetical protein